MSHLDEEDQYSVDALDFESWILDVDLFIKVENPPQDPLDEIIGGWTVRDLIKIDEFNRREGRSPITDYTFALLLSAKQRAAVSAHWSTELRRKIAEAAERERDRVLIDQDE